MEKLYELHERRQYVLLVVDTPPTRSALDFLDAPDNLNQLLDAIRGLPDRVALLATADTTGALSIVEASSDEPVTEDAPARRRRLIAENREALDLLRAYDEGEPGIVDRLRLPPRPRERG